MRGRYRPAKPVTVCYDCKHRQAKMGNGDIFNAEFTNLCEAKPPKQWWDILTGEKTEVLPLCEEVNSGECELFEAMGAAPALPDEAQP